MTIKEEVDTMALRDIFTMVKADKYTADGCEELNKAREADVEDKVYQIGEISQKTGLQKTANGWVKPKSGKQPGTNKPAENKSNAMPKVNGPDMAVRNFERKGEKVTNWNGTKNGFLISTTKGDYQYVEKADGSFELMDSPNVTQGEALQQSIKSHGEKAGSKPILSQTDGKGNKVEIKITESKGGGFYVDKYVNGKKVGINNANTRESAEAKAKSMMEQHMADPGYKAEEKPAGMPGRDYPALKKEDHVKLAKEVKSNTLPGGSDWTAEEIAKEWQLGKADAEEVKKEFDKLKTESKPDAAKEIAEHREAAQYYKRKARSFSETDPSYSTYMKKAEEYENKAKELEGSQPGAKKHSIDSAPRVLTGDCKIRVRK